MIDWRDIALLPLSCVLANHMGLISAVEDLIRHKLPVLNCIKCSTFWVVLFYSIFSGIDIVLALAISFLSSYEAIWLELFFGFIDRCYEAIYATIYKDSATSAETDTYNTDTSHSEDILS